MDDRHWWIAAKVQETFYLNGTANPQILEKFFQKIDNLNQLNLFLNTDSINLLYFYGSINSSVNTTDGTVRDFYLFTSIFEASNLQTQLDNPAFLFFIKPDINEEVSLTSYEKEIFCTEIKGNSLHTFVAMNANVIMPSLKLSNDWKSRLANQKDSFDGTMEKLNHSINSINENQNNMRNQKIITEPDEATIEKQKIQKHTDTEIMDEYEHLMEDWIVTIEKILYEQIDEKNAPAIAGPLVEVDKWKQRHHTLTLLTEQLKSKQCKLVIGTLITGKSKLLKRWRTIDVAITDAYNDTRDKHKYLEGLRKWFKQLYDSDCSLEQILTVTIPKIFQTMKQMESASRHYARTGYLGVLLTKIAYQLKETCQVRIKDLIEAKFKSIDCQSRNDKPVVECDKSKHTEVVGEAQDMPEAEEDFWRIVAEETQHFESKVFVESSLKSLRQLTDAKSKMQDSLVQSGLPAKRPVEGQADMYNNKKAMASSSFANGILDIGIDLGHLIGQIKASCLVCILFRDQIRWLRDSLGISSMTATNLAGPQLGGGAAVYTATGGGGGAVAANSHVSMVNGAGAGATTQPSRAGINSAGHPSQLGNKKASSSQISNYNSFRGGISIYDDDVINENLEKFLNRLRKFIQINQTLSQMFQLSVKVQRIDRPRFVELENMAQTIKLSQINKNRSIETSNYYANDDEDVDEDEVYLENESTEKTEMTETEPIKSATEKTELAENEKILAKKALLSSIMETTEDLSSLAANKIKKSMPKLVDETNDEDTTFKSDSDTKAENASSQKEVEKSNQSTRTIAGDIKGDYSVLVKYYDGDFNNPSLSEVILNYRNEILQLMRDHLTINKLLSIDSETESETKKNAAFEKPFEAYRLMAGEFEQLISGYVNVILLRKMSTNDALDFILKFDPIKQRTNLHGIILDKTSEIFQRYEADLQKIIEMYEREKTCPPETRNFPPVANALSWSKKLYSVIEEPMNKFRDLKEITTFRDYKKIIKMYNKIAKTLLTFQAMYVNQWKTGIDKCLAGLNSTLLTLDTTKDTICLNINQNILELMNETRILIRMGFQVPNSALQILNLEHRVKSSYQRLSELLEKWNSINYQIPQEFNHLFHFQKLVTRQAFHAGLSTLAWNSMNIDPFVHQLRNSLDQFEEVVQQFIQVKQRIQLKLSDISSFLLIDTDEIFSHNWMVNEFNEFSMEIAQLKSNELQGVVLEIEQDLLLFKKLLYTDIKSILIPSQPVNEHIFDEVYEKYEGDIKRAIMTSVFRSLIMIAESAGCDQKNIRQIVEPIKHKLNFQENVDVEKQISVEIQTQRLCKKSTESGNGLDGDEAGGAADFELEINLTSPTQVDFDEAESRASDTETDDDAGEDKSEKKEKSEINEEKIRKKKTSVEQSKDRSFLSPTNESLQKIIEAPVNATSPAGRSQSKLSMLSDSAYMIFRDFSSLQLLKEAQPSSKHIYEIEFIKNLRFKVQIKYNIPKIIITPQLSEIQSSLNHLGRSILGVCKPISWSNGIQFGQKLFDSLNEDEAIEELISLIDRITEDFQPIINDKLKYFSLYDFLWKDNLLLHFTKFMDANPSVKSIKREIENNLKLEQRIHKIPNEIQIGCVCLYCDNILNVLKGMIATWKETFGSAMHSNAQKKLSETINYRKNVDSQLETEVRTLDQLNQTLHLLEELYDMVHKIDKIYLPIENAYDEMKKQSLRLPRDEIVQVQDLRPGWNRLMRKADRVQYELLHERKLSFEQELDKQVKSFVVEVIQFRNSFESQGPVVSGIGPAKAVTLLHSFQQLFNEYNAKRKTLDSVSKLFGIRTRKFAVLDRTNEELKLLSLLYGLFQKFIRFDETFRSTLWAEIDLDQSHKEIESYWDECLALPSKLKDWDAYSDMKSQIQHHLQIHPILKRLAAKEIRNRHWMQVMQLTGLTFQLDANIFKMADLMHPVLISKKSEIEAICLNAQRELELEIKMHQIEEEWTEQVLVFHAYKDRGFVLLDKVITQGLLEQLDDSQGLLAQMLTSRHIGPLKDEAAVWAEKLKDVGLVLELWINVQSLWMDLESVFFNDELKNGSITSGKEISQEIKKFERIDRSYVKMMKRTYETKNVLQCCLSADVSRIGLLKNIYEGLENCFKALTLYLDSKRNTFHRLYFVTNSNLLSIVSKPDDVKNVEPFLNLIFNSINALRVQKRLKDEYTSQTSVSPDKDDNNKTNRKSIITRGNPDKSSGPSNNATGRSQQSDEDSKNFVTEIIRVHSVEGEELNLRKKVSITSVNVEQWLNELKNSTADTLKSLHETVLNEIANSTISSLDELAHKYPSQLCLLGLLIHWTRECETAINEIKSDRKALLALCKKYNNTVSRFPSILYRGTWKSSGEGEPMLPVHKLRLEYMMSVALYLKDIIETMVNRKIREVSDFDWQRNITCRAYTDEHSNRQTPHISLLGETFKFGYEFVGSSSFLCWNPLTERCFVGIFTALQQQRAILLRGTSGSGKTETVKGLANLMQTFLIILQCQASISMESLMSVFKGMGTNGCWTMFEDVNYLSSNGMSQMITCYNEMSNSLREARKYCRFIDGSTLKLESFGLFFTAKFGQNDRLEQNLPKNISSKFRNITMINPNTQQILKLKCVEYGFKVPYVLANRLRVLMTLAKEQIFQESVTQLFSIRNMISVLLHASKQKSQIREVLEPKQDSEKMPSNASSVVNPTGQNEHWPHYREKSNRSPVAGNRMSINYAV